MSELDSPSPRIRPLDLPDEPVAEQESLRYLLLAIALLSVIVPIALLMQDEGALRPKARELTQAELSHLPQMLSIPAGQTADGQAIAAFRLSRTEVTVEQFRIFVQQTGYANPDWADMPCVGTVQDLSWSDPGYDQADTFPVVCVSARDAVAFTAWLSKLRGESLRLPTEREWTYAARANAATRYWWGDRYDAAYADCAGCTPRLLQRPTFVGARPANAFGLLDISGNVREWTCSLFAPVDSQEGAQCATAFDEASNLVVRGGSWQESAEALALDYRQPFGAWHRNVWTGFRVAAAP